MSISVIIPTCNESLNIGRLINFLSLHGGSSLKEILVVDAAASIDRTLEHIPQKKGNRDKIEGYLPGGSNE